VKRTYKLCVFSILHPDVISRNLLASRIKSHTKVELYNEKLKIEERHLPSQQMLFFNINKYKFNKIILKITY